MRDWRNTAPELALMRISGDAFLTQVYLSSTETMLSIAGVDLDAVSDLTVLELGSAGGITKIHTPTIITSDVRSDAGIDIVASGEAIPFASESVDVVIAKDTLHHIPNPVAHFREIERVLKPHGSAVYLEPNWNTLSRWLFRFLHPEPYDTQVGSWIFESSDPMFSNQAMAHNIFVRDESRFKEMFPRLSPKIHQPTNGVAFLVSGGVHTRTPIPARWLLRLDLWERSHPGHLRAFGLGRYIQVTKISGSTSA